LICEDKNNIFKKQLGCKKGAALSKMASVKKSCEIKGKWL